jgi:hypothetical protein
MGAEGTFRRSAWEVLDTRLPEWLQLGGRSRRPPRNAGNAFISYVNGITYARMLTAVRLTPLHSGIAFLHSTMERLAAPVRTGTKCRRVRAPVGDRKPENVDEFGHRLERGQVNAGTGIGVAVATHMAQCVSVRNRRFR